MTDTATIDRPTPSRSTAKVKAATVSVSSLALHLDCSNAYVRKLEGEGVLQRIGTGFALDASRIAYLRFLRRERKQSARSEADADFARAKSELIRMRLDERRGLLVLQSGVDVLIDQIVGTMLTALGGFPAALAGRDLDLRRRAEKLVREVRAKIAEAANSAADEAGEPQEDTA